MRALPLDTTKIGRVTKQDGYPKVDPETNSQKINSEGQPQWTIEAYIKLEAGRKGELITITTTDQKAGDIADGSVLAFPRGLTAGTMATQNGVLQYFSADAIVAEGAQASGAAQKTDK